MHIMPFDLCIHSACMTLQLNKISDFVTASKALVKLPSFINVSGLRSIKFNDLMILLVPPQAPLREIASPSYCLRSKQKWLFDVFPELTTQPQVTG